MIDAAEPFPIGTLVKKREGYDFPGTVVSVFWTTAGKKRYVVEFHSTPMLHIFSESNLERR